MQKPKKIKIGKLVKNGILLTVAFAIISCIATIVEAIFHLASVDWEK